MAKRRRTSPGRRPPRRRHLKTPRGRKDPGTLNAELNTEQSSATPVAALPDEQAVLGADPDPDIGDKEYNLSPSGVEQGFTEFLDDEWTMDEDVKTDFLEARDPATPPLSEGGKPPEPGQGKPPRRRGSKGAPAAKRRRRKEQ